LNSGDPNYTIGSFDILLNWCKEFYEYHDTTPEKMCGINWWNAIVNLKSKTKSTAIKEVQELLKVWRKKRENPSGENVSELLQYDDVVVTRSMDILLGQINDHFKDQHKDNKENMEMPTNHSEEEVIMFYLETYPDPDAKGKLPI
jgi:hypothetical protein